MELYYGVVEDRVDPQQLGRVKVRVAGIHTQNKQEIPTDDLPWSMVMTPTTSPSASGVGTTPYLVEGGWVVVTFMDPMKQQMLVMGTLPGVPVEYRTSSVGFTSQVGAFPRETDVNDMPALSRPGGAETHPSFVNRARSAMSGIVQAAPCRTTTVTPDSTEEGYYDRPEITESTPAETRANNMYPLNYVEEYEGGHVVEYGNTPGEERFSYTHPTGAYQEFDGAGGLSTKSMGPHYEWSHNNRNMVIMGDCNITVYGGMRHYVKGNYHLEIEGDYTQNIKGSMRQKIGSNYESEVLQDFSQTIGNNFQQQIKQNRTVSVVGGNDRLTVAAGSQYLTVQTNMLQTVNGNRTETTLGNKSEVTLGEATYFGKSVLNLDSSTTVSSASAGNTQITAATTGDFNCGGAVTVTGSTIDLN